MKWVGLSFEGEKKYCTFEVLNIRELYTSNPDLVEMSVSRSAVLALIRTGTREIPGLRIYQETKVNIRS
jgi:hypothetical protein